MAQKCDETLDAVSRIVGNFLTKVDGDRYEAVGKEFLGKKTDKFIGSESPIEFFLPGFPCKSPNTVDKSFGAIPDLGEVTALGRLHSMAQEISEVYGPGCRITILSDGTTFNDIVGVTDEVRSKYSLRLRQLSWSPFIFWKDLRDFFPNSKTDDAVRKSLIESAKLPFRNLTDLMQLAAEDKGLRDDHDKLCSYLYNDVRLSREAAQSEDDYLSCISKKACEMIIRRMALSALIDRNVPDAIRLSIHQYSNEGPKFTFGFIEGISKSVQPWHAVPVIPLSGKIALKEHCHIDKCNHALVRFDGEPWTYIEVDEPRASQLGFSLIKPPLFGLKISDPTGGNVSKAISSKMLTRLSEQFGILCLKDVNFEEQSEMVEFCKPFGNIYHWKFGPVHVVKPDENPSGYVHSLEKTPVHWDLSMLPLDHEKVKLDPLFAASKFMLYCKVPPQKGEGQTTVVDGRAVLDIIGRKRMQEWESINVTYYTRMTYFGGYPRTYPLIYTHPDLGKKVFRYQEGSHSKLQEFTVSVDGYSEVDSEALISEINELIYDDKCMIAHEWNAGDLMLVDNWLALHGRLPMTEHSKTRELWRVQVY